METKCEEEGPQLQQSNHRQEWEICPFQGDGPRLRVQAGMFQKGRRRGQKENFGYFQRVRRLQPPECVPERTDGQQGNKEGRRARHEYSVHTKEQRRVKVTKCTINKYYMLFSHSRDAYDSFRLQFLTITDFTQSK